MENSNQKPQRRWLRTFWVVVVVIALLGLGDEQRKLNRRLDALRDQFQKLEKELDDLKKVHLRVQELEEKLDDVKKVRLRPGDSSP